MEVMSRTTGRSGGWQLRGAAGGLLLLLTACATGPGVETPAMLRALPDTDFRVEVLFTVGETIGDYRPPGILDGLAVFPRDAGTLRILATHELESSRGYPYRLDSGLELTGARISYFDIDKATRRIVAAGPAYGRLRDRSGALVTSASAVNERGDPLRGLETLCSAAGYLAGERGFVDDIFFVHEEVSAREAHPHGGTAWALDVAGRELWALPELGRGSWENSAAMAAPDGFVALLLGDDLEFGGAPLYLWLGRREPGGDFIARNGLRDGRLHVWVPDDGSADAADWRGTGKVLAGRFVPVATREATRAGQRGHDALGYRDDTTLRSAAFAAGAFRFSRPEDLHANPADPREAVFASTGHGVAVPADDWGTLYVVRLEFADAGAGGWPEARATLRILHDADDFADFGIRSPDNLVWAADGLVYVQEDKATKRGRFGAASGRDASVWQIDPRDPESRQRIAEIDRRAVLPAGSRDRKAAEFGAWESSGIIDISRALGARPDERVLLLTVQAHGLAGGPIGGRQALVEGGQLLMLSRRVSGPPD
jgi:hypothetical protein